MVLFLTACNQKQVDTNAPTAMRFTTKNQKSVSGNCSDTIANSCAEVEFSFPFFESNGDSFLNQFVTEKLGEGYMDTLHHQKIEEVMQQFLNSYDTVHSNMPTFSGRWNWTKKIEVLSQSANFVTLHVSVYEYAGGAHPNSYEEYFHFDRKLQQLVQLPDLMKAGGERQLQNIAENRFRDSFSLKKEVRLDSAGFFFEGGQFSLPKNFYFSKTGVVFHYNDYEIRSHAEGPYDLEVPFQDLKDLAKPNSYLESCFKASN